MDPGLAEALREAVSSPEALAGFAAQFLLGLGLGYVSAKALKYILAFMGLLVLAAAVNGYTLGSSLEGVMREYYRELSEVAPHVKSMLATVGLLTLGPASAGFLVGAAIGVLKR